MSSTSTSPSLPGPITCRVATLEDYQEIVSNFPDIYHGIDYLPHDYPGYFVKNNFVCFVALVNGNIVGFVFYQLIDCGQGQIRGGARIAEEHRNYGIWPVLRNYAATYMMEKYPSAHKWIRGSAVENTVIEDRINTNRTLLHFFRTFQVVYKQFQKARNVSDIMHLCKNVSGRFVTVGSAQAALDLLKRPDVRRNFLPKDNSGMELENYGLYIDNFEYEFDVAKTIMQCLYRSGDVDKTPEECITPSSITFTRSYPCPGGFSVVVDYYGLSIEEFYYHFWKCLTHVLNNDKISEETTVYLRWSTDSLTLSEDIATALCDKLQWVKHQPYGQRVFKKYYYTDNAREILNHL